MANSTSEPDHHRPDGPTHQEHAECSADAIHATPALYDHDVDHCNKMEVKPDCYVQPKPDNPSLINTLRKVNHLHLPERIRLTTVKNTACRTTIPTVSSAWATASTLPIPGVEKETVEKAVVMILNSTPGKLGMLMVKSNKIPSYTPFSKDSLEQIPMPRIAGLTKDQLSGLAAKYKKLADKERKPLPQAHQCEIQKMIDDAVCEHIGFDSNICESARHLLAQEPMITGQRYQFGPTA